MPQYPTNAKIERIPRPEHKRRNNKKDHYTVLVGTAIIASEEERQTKSVEYILPDELEHRVINQSPIRLNVSSEPLLEPELTSPPSIGRLPLIVDVIQVISVCHLSFLP